MEAKGIKVEIKSQEPYIRDFNGKTATATDFVGLVSGRQSFSLDTSGSIFLDPTDYRKL